MTFLFWGLLIVVVDIRVDGFDLVVDAVGWLLAVIGTGRLRAVDPWFRAAFGGAVVGGIGSLAQVVTGTPGMIQTAVETVAITVVVFGVCTVVARVAALEHPTLAGRARAIRAADVVTSAVSLVLSLLTGGATTVPVMGATVVLVLLFALVTLAVLVCFLVLVWVVRRRFDVVDPAPAPA
jgi:hypothetical protein